MTTPLYGRLGRRRVLALSAATVALGAVPRPLAAALAPTPAQGLGPFYPFHQRLVPDGDLTSVAGGSGLPEGRIIEVAGRVLGPDGRPLPGARVEVWQTNAHGRYHHPRDNRADAPIDPNFQGWGVDIADEDGAYLFRTVRPAAYPAGGEWMRPPHIHFAVVAPGSEPLVTQMYFAGEPLNEDDLLLQGVGDAERRRRLIVEFRPAPADAAPVAERGVFDIVIGA